MKRTLYLAALFVFTGFACPQKSHIVHTFEYWGKLEGPVEKIQYYGGFTNGFFDGSSSSTRNSLRTCIETNISDMQALAMIDKYYRSNPEKWQIPVGHGIVLALTVKDGPCPLTDPWQ